MTTTNPRRAAWANSDSSLRRILLDICEAGALETARLTRREIEELLASWAVRAHGYQYFPGLLDGRSPWAGRPTWLLLGGRGAGKTRTGAEWIRGLALGLTDFAERPLGRFALVGETFAQAAT
jgi:phage terminase large subunit-like protein